MEGFLGQLSSVFRGGGNNDGCLGQKTLKGWDHCLGHFDFPEGYGMNHRMKQAGYDGRAELLAAARELFNIKPSDN